MDPLLKFNIRNQNISRVDTFHVVANSKNYLRAEFAFLTGDWNGISKTAIFDNGENTYEMLLDENGTCMVPWEWLKEPGTEYVSVFGGDLITANKATVIVHESGYRDGKTPESPTPDIYQQIIGLIAGKADNMDISGNKLILKSGETVIATVDIPAASDEAIENAVNSYLQDNPIEIVTDKSLTEEDVPADAKATGDRITQLSGKVESLNNVDFHFCSAEEVSVDGTPNIENPMEKVIYFVPNNGETPNVFDEYIWHGSWEYFGSASVDMSDYVKFTDYASGEKAGVILVSSNRSIGNGVELNDAKILRIMLTNDTEIMGKNKITRCPITPRNIDIISVQSAHQEMSDTYDPETATTPDGNVSYAYGGRQPVSYDAAKRYVDGQEDWKNTPVLDIEVTEDVTYIDITEINGKAFNFEQIDGLYYIPSVEANYEARLLICLDTAGASYNGLQLGHQNGTVGEPVISMFTVYKTHGAWVSEYSNAIDNSWIGNSSGIYRHMRNFSPTYPMSSANVKTITKFRILPYNGYIRVGTIIKIYGRTARTEEVTE